jgi:hypothetical protein
MTPHEYRAVVFIVEGRSRSISGTDISAAIDDRCRSKIGMTNNGQTYSDMSGADTGADEYLSIAFGSDEAGGYNDGEDK